MFSYPWTIGVAYNPWFEIDFSLINVFFFYVKNYILSRVLIPDEIVFIYKKNHQRPAIYNSYSSFVLWRIHVLQKKNTAQNMVFTVVYTRIFFIFIYHHVINLSIYFQNFNSLLSLLISFNTWNLLNLLIIVNLLQLIF